MLMYVTLRDVTGASTQSSSRVVGNKYRLSSTANGSVLHSHGSACCLSTYTSFTRSNNHRANVEQTSSKYVACIKHSLQDANIKQTSRKHQANVEQTSNKHLAIRAYVVCVYYECICWMFAP